VLQLLESWRLVLQEMKDRDTVLLSECCCTVSLLILLAVSWRVGMF